MAELTINQSHSNSQPKVGDLYRHRTDGNVAILILPAHGTSTNTQALCIKTGTIVPDWAPSPSGCHIKLEPGQSITLTQE